MWKFHECCHQSDMHLLEILRGPSPHAEQLFLLKNNCSRFIKESKGLPIFKQLPATSEAVSRIKVRHKANPINQFFAESILRGTSGGKTIIESKSTPYPDRHNFWMFPTNGYSYLYSPQVQNYRQCIETAQAQTSDPDLIRELVQSMHISSNLAEGIELGTEILWYGISSYYAVDCSCFMDYNELLSLL
jgi:hypothetical protein